MSVFKYLNVRVLSWIFVMQIFKCEHLSAMCLERVRAHRKIVMYAHPMFGLIANCCAPVATASGMLHWENICTSHLQRVRRQRRRPRRRLRWQAPAAAALPRTFSLTSKASLHRRIFDNSVELVQTGRPVAEVVVHGCPVLVFLAVVPLADCANLGPRRTHAPLAGMIGQQFI